LLVAVRTEGRDGGHSDMFTAAGIIKQAAIWQDRNGTGDVKVIEFQIWVPTRDQYGNSDIDRALILKYPISELRKVNWDGFTLWDLLNLADIAERTKLGLGLVGNFCADKDSGHYAKRFCANVLLGI
jgi:hypothetical protein